MSISTGAVISGIGGLIVGLGVGGGDRVAVLNSAFQQVFQYARPVNVDVSEKSKLFDYPIETGQIITDYAIVLPIEITMQMIVPAQYYRSTYQQIKGLYLTKQLLTVQTNTSNYPNMVIEEMPHQEKPELYDALQIVLRFRQVQLVPDPTTFAPSDTTQNSTVSLGQQNPTTAVPVTTATPVEVAPGVTVAPGSPYYSSVPQITPSNYSVGSVVAPQSIASSVNPIEIAPGITTTQSFTSQSSIASAFGGVAP